MVMGKQEIFQNRVSNCKSQERTVYLGNCHNSEWPEYNMPLEEEEKLTLENRGRIEKNLIVLIGEHYPNRRKGF